MGCLLGEPLAQVKMYLWMNEVTNNPTMYFGCKRFLAPIAIFILNYITQTWSIKMAIVGSVGNLLASNKFPHGGFWLRDSSFVSFFRMAVSGPGSGR